MNDFFVMGSVANPATEEQIKKYEESTGYPSAKMLRISNLIRFPNFEVKEEIWKRPQEFDVLPSWKFGYGFFVVDYIKRNLHQKLSIDSIAKLAYVSKSNFFKMFKDELGTSPNDFILQERINRAKELLSSQISIKETAFQTGFSDTNYFTRVFKQLERRGLLKS
ncbi:helix-turn-helix transcriptional regulator [Chryseobacterium sp. CH1]|uniref:helix-turn-helix transcriptional regulator n=1 Tax=Chryseobacterium sp. CH1 TaxID=713551 RepID=UPI001E5D1891|nr:AraC family transcriptional regulator [Chryseobacterium sp. CH1]